ncbi:MAG: sulfatase [Verrucomicrobiota bacterium]
MTPRILPLLCLLGAQTIAAAESKPSVDQPANRSTDQPVNRSTAPKAPNILFFFADDWGRYASIYADPDNPSLNDVISTPNIDRIGREGVVFDNAFVPVASCGPCRASLATGRHFWNCGAGAFLKGKPSSWKDVENPLKTLPKFGDLLRKNGYFARRSQKTFLFDTSKITQAEKDFGQVGYERYGLYVGTAADEEERQKRHNEIVENSRREIQKLLAGTPEGRPFFFVYGSINVHRPYTPDSGKELWGIEPDALEGVIPNFLPDVHDVRRDFSDYLGEVLALDLKLGAMLEELEKAGVLDDTLIILSGDHGIPGVPRGKTNCYDLATRVPMLVRHPPSIPAGRRVTDFVSVMDVGPTLLEVAGLEVPESMDGRSFHPQLTSKKNGWIDKKRDFVVIGRERHVPEARAGQLPYPMRAIRSKDYLYIRNFKTDRWPMGTPQNAANVTNPDELYALGLETRTAYPDLDGSLTKAYMMSQRDQPGTDAELFALTMTQRPSEELYHIKKDPEHLENLTNDPELAPVLEKFRSQVDKIMQDTKDPRLNDAFDRAPWIDPQNTEPKS